MGLSRQEYCSGAPLNSINSHGAGSAQSLTGHPDRHHDIPTCHPRGAPFPREWEIMPRKPAPSLSTASLSPMKGHGHSGNLSWVEQTRDLLWSHPYSAWTHSSFFFFFFFLSEFYLLKSFYLFIYLFLAFLATCRFSPVMASGGLLSSCSGQASHCGGFSCAARALGHAGLSHCGPRA